MKWCAYNAFGGAAWLGGIVLAKAATLTDGASGLYEPHIVAGVTVGAVGLVVLLWTNFRTSS